MTFTKPLSSLAAVALLGTLAVAGASARQGPAPYNPPGFERGQGGSNQNLRGVERRIAREIATMRNDQHDYDGHRVSAIADLEAARNEIRAAEAYARNRGY